MIRRLESSAEQLVHVQLVAVDPNRAAHANAPLPGPEWIDRELVLFCHVIAEPRGTCKLVARRAVDHTQLAAARDQQAIEATVKRRYGVDRIAERVLAQKAARRRIVERH